MKLDVKNKRVLVRVDFNVPLDEKGRITDTTRIEAALPTLQYILANGGSCIVMSHLGRPKGKRDPKYSLQPCGDYLQNYAPTKMANDCIGPEVKEQAEKLQPGEILLLENLRFHAAETKPEEDPSFAQQLAELGDLYINDAFGTAHRKHSSTYTITKYFEGKSAPGLLLEKEIKFLGEALTHPKRPFYALVGGAKISTKLGVLHSLLEKVDALFIGGAMSYTFMAAKKIPIGTSLFEPNLLDEANAIAQKATEKGIKLFLPIDVVVTTKEGKVRIATATKGFSEKEEGVDIGPKTLELYSKKLKEAKTLFWNGPFGKYEDAEFAKGTLALLEQFAHAKAITIIGGGDLVAASKKAHVEDKISHISTGGGASLEYIEKNTLPALTALKQ